MDENGWSALHYAGHGGFARIVKLLLDEGIDRNMRDNKKRRALHIALHMKQYVEKNPPITKEEKIAFMETDYGKCISLMEDAKSRIADIAGDIEY